MALQTPAPEFSKLYTFQLMVSLLPANRHPSTQQPAFSHHQGSGFWRAGCSMCQSLPSEVQCTEREI